MAKLYPITTAHNHDEVYAKIGEGGVTDHGLLTGLEDNDHPQYLLTTGKAADSDKLDNIDSAGFVQTSGNQTVAGIKTFSSIPVLPATNPTTANQAVRKGYADAAYLGKTGKASDADKLDGLDSTAFGRPVFLAGALTSTAWDGDAFSTTAKTLIDLSTVFGVPAGVKAVLVKIALRDSGSAATSCLFQLSGISSGTNYALTAQASPINDRYAYFNGIVPCDANGDIHYMATASGSGTMDIYLEIWGYWL